MVPDAKADSLSDLYSGTPIPVVNGTVRLSVLAQSGRVYEFR